MARVYAALVRGPFASARLVALKEMRTELTSDATFVRMFVEEARLATRLRHANVIQTYEVGEDGGRPFLAMELVDGLSYGAVRKGGALPLAAHVRILVEVLAGLDYAHNLTDLDGRSLGVVHRDVSPSNVLLGWDGTVKVIDFGIASADPMACAEGGGRLFGKLSYMAPEQARCEAIDPRADIFSVGVLLWEAVAERRLWEGWLPRFEVYDNLANGRIPDLLRARPDASPVLAAICARALMPRAEDRFDSAAAMAAALETWLMAHEPQMTARRVGEILASKFADNRRETQRRRADAVTRILHGIERAPMWSGPAPAPELSMDAGPRSTAPHAVDVDASASTRAQTKPGRASALVLVASGVVGLVVGLASVTGLAPLEGFAANVLRHPTFGAVAPSAPPPPPVAAVATVPSSASPPPASSSSASPSPRADANDGIATATATASASASPVAKPPTTGASIAPKPPPLPIARTAFAIAPPPPPVAAPPAKKPTLGLDTDNPYGR